MTQPRILNSGPMNSVDCAFDGSLAVPMYCLMWQDTDDAKPAASVTDQGSEALNQAYFASRFLGLANFSKLSTQTDTDTVNIITDCVADVDCVSATYEVGDKVTIDEDSGGTFLENLKVVGTGSEANAIGYVVKREGSATTTVRVRFISRVCPNNSMDPDLAEEPSSVTTTDIIFDGATTENEITVPTNLADALSVSDSAGDLIVIDTSTGSQLITFTPEVHFNGGIQLNDSDNLTLGTGDDVTLRWDGTDLDLLPAADDSVFKIGNGTLSFDVWIYGATANDNIIFDASGNTLALDGVDLYLEDNDILAFGDAQDCTFTFNATNLVISPLAAGGAIHIGDASDTAANLVHIFDGGTDKPGMLVLYDHAGSAHYLWVDNTGDLRVHTSAPSDEDMDGTIVGSQS